VLTALSGLCATLGASQAGGAVAVRYERVLSLSQGRDGQPRPVAVSCDPRSGEICVTESVSSALHVFNAAGIETFRTGSYANLSQPNDGTVDHEGRLVAVATVAGSRATIARLDVYGEPDAWTPEIPAAGWYPTHLTVTRDGHYVTVDGNSGLLAKHDADTGALLWSKTIATPNPDDPNLDMDLGRPVQLADGSFAVAGNNLHCILLLGEDGEFLTSFGRFGSSPGRMVAPVATAAGPQGTLLVLDQMRHKILAFDGQHEFLSEYGSIGDAPGAFYHPVSMAADGTGHVYVAQGYRGRVQVFSVLADGTVE